MLRTPPAAWTAQSKPFDRILLIDVLGNRFDFMIVVTKHFQTQRHGLVDDLQHAAASELLVLDQCDIGLDSRRVAVHHETDRAGRRKHR